MSRVLQLIEGEAMAHRGRNRIQIGSEARQRGCGGGVVRACERYQVVAAFQKDAH